MAILNLQEGQRLEKDYRKPCERSKQLIAATYIVSAPLGVPKVLDQFKVTSKQYRETVISIQSNLSGELHRAFEETLDPRLVSLLQEHLQPINLSLIEGGQTAAQQHEVIVSKLDSQRTNLNLLQTAQADLRTFSWNLTQRSDMLLCKMQEHELNQIAAIDTVKQHITTAIKELKTEPTNPFNGIASPRRQLNSKRRTNPLDQPLQMLQAASKNELLDRGSLEEM